MHARLTANILRMKPRLKPGTWGQLAAPIRAGDNQNIARAHSYLLNWVKDSSGLTPEEAFDVVTWMDQKGIK